MDTASAIQTLSPQSSLLGSVIMYSEGRTSKGRPLHAVLGVSSSPFLPARSIYVVIQLLLRVQVVDNGQASDEYGVHSTVDGLRFFFCLAEVDNMAALGVYCVHSGSRS